MLKKLFIFLLRRMPLGEDIILESHPAFSDNTQAFYQYLLEKGVNKRRKIHWALYSSEEKPEDLPENVDTFMLEPSGIRQIWKRLYVLYRSRYILDCNAYIHKRRKGQFRVHLGHGMWIKVTPGYHNVEKIGDCDGYLVTSPFFIPLFSEKAGIPAERMIPLGYPRNDVFADGEKKENRLGRYLMWLPTYRQHRRHPENDGTAYFPYGMPEIETKEQLYALNNCLDACGYTLYLRPHPVQDMSGWEKINLSHIRIADDSFLKENGLTLYEMLAASAALITDYSSVYYDFLLTERPIGLTIRDRDSYFDRYGCIFEDLKDNIRGGYIESCEDLMDFIKMTAEGRNDCQEELRVLKKRYHSYTDGRASERIYQYIKEKR